MTFDTEYFNIGYLDSLSYKDTFVHRLDPRVKLLVSFIFILCVVSFPRHEITGLMPFFIYPAFLLAAGDIPLNAIAKKIIFVSPFAVLIGIFNPLFDRDVIAAFYGIQITGGWLSFFSILVKFILTVSAMLLLVAVTSFPGLCESLERLRLPKAFVIQLLFLYRYLFVLLEEALRMMRAREARSFDGKGRDIKTFIKFISVLLIRTLERAERIYQAMLSRGFKGEIRMNRRYKPGIRDLLFTMISIAMFYAFRKYDIVNLVGNTLGGPLR
ncbi:MAG: cobalt ECF transporter T component CbiQ [Thermodesulfovibrionales bacterium]|nr:cobalt ECF transporter T component CbiQ [Thermodesulfovibrionales bacterium]